MEDGSNVLVRHCVFMGNHAYQDKLLTVPTHYEVLTKQHWFDSGNGGAVKIVDSIATFEDSHFSNNTGTRHGGSVSAKRSLLSMHRCSVSYSSALDGGAVTQCMTSRAGSSPLNLKPVS